MSHRRAPYPFWGLGLGEQVAGFGGQPQKLLFLFFDSLPKGMDNVWLRQIFRHYGNIVDVFVSKKQCKNNDAYFRFVRFALQSEASEALRCNNGLGVVVISKMGDIGGIHCVSQVGTNNGNECGDGSLADDHIGGDAQCEENQEFLLYLQEKLGGDPSGQVGKLNWEIELANLGLGMNIEVQHHRCNRDKGDFGGCGIAINVSFKKKRDRPKKVVNTPSSKSMDEVRNGSPTKEAWETWDVVKTLGVASPDENCVVEKLHRSIRLVLMDNLE